MPQTGSVVICKLFSVIGCVGIIPQLVSKYGKEPLERALSDDRELFDREFKATVQVEPLPDRQSGGTIWLSTRTSQTAMNRELQKRTRSMTFAARIVVCNVLAFSFVVSSI